MVLDTIMLTSRQTMSCYGYQRSDISCAHAFALILRLNYEFPIVFGPAVEPHADSEERTAMS